MTTVLGLSLAWVTLMGASTSASSPDRIEVLLEQVARLATIDQQRFLFWVESRLNRAREITLPSAKAAAARAELRIRLRRAAITWAELRSLLVELDRRESQSIEQLTRQYRLQTFRTFRNARDTYEQRQQVWFGLYGAWQSAGRPLLHQHELLNWLVVAIQRSQPATLAPLPAVPHFTVGSLVSLLPEAPVRPTLPALPPEHFAIQEPSAKEDRNETAMEAWPVPAVPEPAPTRNGAPTAWFSSPNGPIVAKRATAFRDHGGPVTSTVSALASPITPEIAAPAARRQAGPVDSWVPAAGRSPARRTLSPRLGRLPSRLPLPNSHSSPSPTFTIEPVVHQESRERMAATDHICLSRPATVSPPIFASPNAPCMALPDRRHAGLPFIATSPDIGRDVFRAPRTLHFQVDTALADASDNAPASRPTPQVNLTELRSRIAGTNLALQALESKLYERQPRSADQLALLVTRLHVLALRVEDIRLFRKMVPKDVRKLVDAADSPRPAITLLAARIAESRQRIVDGQYRSPETEREAELQKLDELSRRLAEIAGLQSQ